MLMLQNFLSNPESWVKIQSGPKKTPYFVFHLKVVFYNFFEYFPSGVDSRPGRFV